MKQFFSRVECSDIQHHTDESGRYVAGFKDGIEYVFFAGSHRSFQLLVNNIPTLQSVEFNDITTSLRKRGLPAPL